MGQLCALAGSDSSALARCATPPAAQQRPRPDAEIVFGGAVSFLNLPLASHHSITSSASASKVGGTSRPSALAVLALMTSSKRVGCSIGKSDGRDPLRILSTSAAARL